MLPTCFFHSALLSSFPNSSPTKPRVSVIFPILHPGFSSLQVFEPLLRSGYSCTRFIPRRASPILCGRSVILVVFLISCRGGHWIGSIWPFGYLCNSLYSQTKTHKSEELQGSMERVGFLGIFEESRRIISAHSRHFLGLSVLFLLPIAVLTCAASTFRNWIETNEAQVELLSSVRPGSHNSNSVQDFLPFPHSGHSNAKGIKVIILLFMYAVVIFGLALCSNAAVTHSICNGFFGRGVKLPSAIKSVPGSVWRLAFTAGCALLALVGISVVIGLFFSLGIMVLSAFNVQLLSLTPVYIAMLAFVGLVAINLQIHWTIASVIPVVEGSWGLEPLRRSAYLVKGMRLVAFTLSLFFGICGLALGFWANYLQSSASDSLDLLSKIIQSITVLAGMTILFLYNIATNTVFYMYCKAYHNELLGAIVEEFAQDYMSLPFDEQKIPQVVTIAEP